MEAGWSETETRAEGESERSEWQRYSGMATGYPVTELGKKAALDCFMIHAIQPADYANRTWWWLWFCADPHRGDGFGRSLLMTLA